MSSPARQARQRILAALAANEDNTLTFSSAEQEIFHNFRQHSALLKSIQSEKTREAEKAKLLPLYTGHIEGVMAGNSSSPIFAGLTLWAIDAGQLDLAAQMAAHAIDHKLEFDDEFKRTAPEVFAEEIAKKVLDGVEITPTHLEVLLAVLDVVDINDKIRAKLCKAFAQLIEENRPDDALVYYRQADDLDERSGVKKKITELEKLTTKT